MTLKEKIFKKIDESIYLKKANMAMVILSLFYLIISFYSLYNHSKGFYFIPENRVRFLRVFMFIVFLFTYFILVPNKKTHKISLFTAILNIVFSVSTGLFLTIIIGENLKYTAVTTMLLIAISLCLTIFSVGNLKRNFSKTKWIEDHPIFLSIPRYVNYALVLFILIIFIVTGVKGERHKQVGSFGTTYSPQNDYVVKAEKYSHSPENAFICVYEIHKDKKVLMGKWTYNGKPVKKVKVDTADNFYYSWINDKTFSVNGTTIEIK